MCLLGGIAIPWMNLLLLVLTYRIYLYTQGYPDRSELGQQTWNELEAVTGWPMNTNIELRSTTGLSNCKKELLMLA